MATSSATFEELESAATSATVATSQTTPTETTEAGKDAAAQAAAAAASATETSLTGQEAEQLSRLADLGITPDNASEILEKGQSLDQLSYMLEKNPKGFFEQLERANPERAAAVLDIAADLYLERNPLPADGGQAGAGKTGSDTALTREIARLRQTVEGITEQNAKRERQAATEATRQAYNDRVTDIFKAEQFKALDPNERELISLKVNAEIGKDPKALARINKGVFSDVPRVFKQVFDGVMAAKKSANAAEHQKRKDVANNASLGTEVATGASPAAGVVAGSGSPDDDPIWGEESSQALAKSLSKK